MNFAIFPMYEIKKINKPLDGGEGLAYIIFRVEPDEKGWLAG